MNKRGVSENRLRDSFRFRENRCSENRNLLEGAIEMLRVFIFIPM